MFEGDWSELDAAATLAAAAECDEDENHAALGKLRAALRFADLHSELSPRSQTAQTKPGRERLKVYGGDGCPPVAEFAPAEFAGVLGLTTRTGTALIGEALALRHRFPRLWASTLAEHTRAWRARAVARGCLQLSLEAAHWVDQRITGKINQLSTTQFYDLLAALIKQADPAAAHRAAENHAKERGVFVNPSDGEGTKTIYVKAATGDVIRFDATICDLAWALAMMGDTDTADQRRAKAIGWIADPAAAYELLNAARYLATHQPHTGTTTPGTTTPGATCHEACTESCAGTCTTPTNTSTADPATSTAAPTAGTHPGTHNATSDAPTAHPGAGGSTGAGKDSGRNSSTSAAADRATIDDCVPGASTGTPDRPSADEPRPDEATDPVAPARDTGEESAAKQADPATHDLPNDEFLADEPSGQATADTAISSCPDTFRTSTSTGTGEGPTREQADLGTHDLGRDGSPAAELGGQTDLDTVIDSDTSFGLDPARAGTGEESAREQAGPVTDGQAASAARDQSDEWCDEWWPGEEPSLDDEADRDTPHPSVGGHLDHLDTLSTGDILKAIAREAWRHPRPPDVARPADCGGPHDSGPHGSEPVARQGTSLPTTSTTMAEGEGADPADAFSRDALAAKLAAIKRAAHTTGSGTGGLGTGGVRRRPQTVVNVHLTDHALQTGDGIIRVEEHGVLLASRLRELLGHDQVVLKPVIDLKDKVHVSCYEIPIRIRERVKLIHPIEQFPYGTTETTMRTDLDHVVAYDPTGPPEQTSTTNLSPAGRFHHRLKTHSNWRVDPTDDGALRWTSPNGFQFRVDHNGTHRITNNDDSDRETDDNEPDDKEADDL